MYQCAVVLLEFQFILEIVTFGVKDSKTHDFGKHEKIAIEILKVIILCFFCSNSRGKFEAV
jgi:hypothetical protein